MLDKITVGRFAVHKVGEEIQYYIEGEAFNIVLDWDSPERITLDVVKEIFDRESRDNGLKWK
ncbi:hypothetical protein [Pantoea sp. SS70]|uniref:hypothetical protein n=1 Tax=Pantoea sp. SS70 TaxID=3024247 RepID=UPI00245340BE|nr:hypothetical protein [Pantoea sp. SS70]WGK58975.1 hypothetical protein PO881_09285 [Pantoea sp. SS70]